MGYITVKLSKQLRAEDQHAFASFGPDATVENHGSIALVRPLTDAARDWLHENVHEGASYFGSALAVEPRYVAQLVEGMIGAGLVIV